MPFVSVEAINDGEEGGDDGLFRFTRTGDTSQPLTVYYTIGGDATGEGDEDYEELSGSVTFAAYSSTADVSVTVTDDADDEPNEFVSLTIDENSAYWVDDPGSATLAILDDDLPEITLAKIIDAAEGGGNGLFRFYRTFGDLSEALTVSYSVSGTATSGTDYTAISGSVTIEANALTADVLVSPIPDGSSESTETVVATLSASANYTNGAANSATVGIADVAPGWVTGLMWSDDNGDGQKASGEAGLAYARVFLMKGTEVVARATTGSDGTYAFTGIWYTGFAPGAYTVMFGVPSGFTPTVNTGGMKSITITAGAGVTDASEGCKPPASPPAATGNRAGIKWSSFDLSSGVETAYVQGVIGMRYEVKTIAGNTFNVFVADPWVTQSPLIRLRTMFMGLDITYNCHGYSMDMLNVYTADGRCFNFTCYDNLNTSPPLSSSTVLKDAYTPLDSAAKVAAAMAGKKKIIVSLATVGGASIHSAVVTKIQLNLDGSISFKSECSTKNGWVAFATGVTIEKLADIYIPQGAATGDFWALK